MKGDCRRSGLSVCLALCVCCLATSACQDVQGDCLESGHCQCRDVADCPRGEHCVDGQCVLITGTLKPQRVFAEACLANDDCLSSRCLPEGPGNGGVCTRKCDEVPCPEGWACKTQVEATDVPPVSLCVQGISSRLCQACSVDSQCNAIGDLCLQLKGGRFCALDCGMAGCPAGTQCTTVETARGPAQQCVPLGGDCDCSQETIGLTRPCSRMNEHGSCAGRETCVVVSGQADWSACDAIEPGPEICNGLDDDCDGLIDAADPGVDISGLPVEPAYPLCRKGDDQGDCLGIWRCQIDEDDAFDWVCGASDPQAEECNYRDDNCDGRVDELFRDAAGHYLHPQHCGACGADCLVIVPHLRRNSEGNVLEAAATCMLNGEMSICVPLICEPGYAPFPAAGHDALPLTCAELISPACQPCSQDPDCRVASDPCIPIGDDPGTYCAQSCEPDAPYSGCSGQVGERSCCPPGYLCSAVDGRRLCMPENGTCTCDRESLGLSRTCLLTGADTSECQGAQTCQEPVPDVFAYSECAPADVAIEVCDYLDNNCDGSIDEGFRDLAGNYITDAHCGVCNNNCLARWDAEIQHAVGGCVEEPDGQACRIVACTTGIFDDYAFLTGTGSCRRSEDCATGLACDPVIHYCLRDDSGICPAGACNSERQIEFQFVDANKLEADGCECAVMMGDEPDEPDVSLQLPQAGWPYVDRDCDGIDGQALTALFVWAGSGDSKGSRDKPFRTLTEALQVFDPDRHSAILVAGGTYRENIRLPSGVRCYGGYSWDFSQRDVVLYPSQLSGSPVTMTGQIHPATVTVEKSLSRTVLSGFHLFGPDAQDAGGNSYAVYAVDCDDNLEISNNFILAGRGGDGRPGEPGSAGASGTPGQIGQDTWECPYSADCDGLMRAGGAGGLNASCPAAGGHAGANARAYNTGTQDYPTGGIDGIGGINSVYAHSDSSQNDLCKYDCQVGAGLGTSINGLAATAGDDGQAGSGGIGCQQPAGWIVAGHWQATPAHSGGNGLAGGGGGGGGAGGAVRNDNIFTDCTPGEPFGDLGASGGGGGGGGCGAKGGRPGSGGGGSFGVFLYASARVSEGPRIFGNAIQRGFGGKGAAGGWGGLGGLGGQGGAGGNVVLPAWCAGAGGHGGRGGDGGAGGGGGGGCGGVSYGIAGNQPLPAAYLEQNLFPLPGTTETGGAGGAGGPSPAGEPNAGGPGAGGVASDLGVLR